MIIVGVELQKSMYDEVAAAAYSNQHGSLGQWRPRTVDHSIRASTRVRIDIQVEQDYDVNSDKSVCSSQGEGSDALESKVTEEDGHYA